MNTRRLNDIGEREIHVVKVAITYTRIHYSFATNTRPITIGYSVSAVKGKNYRRENAITLLQRAILNAANEHCFVRFKNKRFLDGRNTLNSYLLKE